MIRAWIRDKCSPVQSRGKTYRSTAPSFGSAYSCPVTFLSGSRTYGQRGNYCYLATTLLQVSSRALKEHHLLMVISKKRNFSALLTFTPFKGLFFHLFKILSCVPLYRLVKIMRPSTRLTSPPTRGFPKAFFSLVISCNSPSLPTYLEILSKTCELENLCPPWRLVKWGSHCNKNPKERLVYLKIERKIIDWLMLASSCSLLTARGQKEGRRHPPGLTEERNAACFFGDLLPGYKTAGNDSIDSFLSRCCHGFICWGRPFHSSSRTFPTGPVPVLSGLQTIFLIYFFLVSLTG